MVEEVKSSKDNDLTFNFQDELSEEKKEKIKARVRKSFNLVNNIEYIYLGGNKL